MAQTRCKICGSDCLWGAISLRVTTNKVTVCESCIEQIKSATKVNYSDVEHDRFIAVIRGIRKLVINRSYGGFGLSAAAKIEYLQRAKINYTLHPQSDRHTEFLYGQQIKLTNGTYWDESYIDRSDSILVSIVETMGEKANGPHADLKIVEIPADVNWIIEEYDGLEWVTEPHRTWK